MAVKMSERDLEALRAGITEQAERDVRRELSQQDFDRERAKRLVSRARVITAAELKVGDSICSSSGWRFFKEEYVVERIFEGESHEGGKIAGDRWVITRGVNGGGGGTALRNDDPVLVEIRDED